MGTSKTNDGPGDRTPLLPDWAQDDGDDIPLPDDDTFPEIDQEDENQPAQDLPLPDTEITETFKPWQQAKSNLTRFTMTGERQKLSNAGRSYVRARGGSRRAAQSSTAGRNATGRFVGFLARVATKGITDALDSIGLRDLIGQPVEIALAALMNVLAPTGAGLDDAAARKSVDIALLSIFEEFGVDADGLDRLNDMDAAAIEKSFQTVVSEYIFQRWMMELGKRVEEGAVSAKEALRLERIAKECINETVQLDFRDYDVISTDWSAAKNQNIISDIYAQAYTFLEDL